MSRFIPAPRRAIGPGTRWASVRRGRADVPAEPIGSPATDGTTVSPTDFYTALRRTGAHHGHAFAALTRIVRNARRLGGDRDRPARRGHSAPGHSAAPRDARRRAAGPGRRDELPNPFRIPPMSRICRSGSSPSGCSVTSDRRARCRAELISVVEDTGDALGRVTLTDDAGTVTRRGQRRVPQAHPAPHRAIAVVPEDLRHRSG